MRKPKGVTGMLCLRGRCTGGKGEAESRQLPVSLLPRGSAGADSAYFASLFFPFRWERFPVCLDWLDLPAEHSPVPGGFVPEAASWAGRGRRVCLGPQCVSWTEVSKSVCSDGVHKAHRALRKSGQRQPARMTASCRPPRLTNCNPAPNACATSEGLAAHLPQ